jgi:hypothetical protein
LIYTEIVPPDRTIPDDEESEEEIFGQLSLTLKYEPTVELQAITPGNMWCEDLAALPAFTTFVADCEATKRVHQRTIIARELHFENAE